MAGILSVSLTAGAVTPAFASAAPDGKTDAASLAGGMGISRNWESWKAEWEAVKNDWTQVSLTPGSDFSQLNFAWYSKKDNSDTATMRPPVEDEIGRVASPEPLANDDFTDFDNTDFTDTDFEFTDDVFSAVSEDYMADNINDFINGLPASLQADTRQMLDDGSLTMYCE